MLQHPLIRRAAHTHGADRPDELVPRGFVVAAWRLEEPVERVAFIGDESVEGGRREVDDLLMRDRTPASADYAPRAIVARSCGRRPFRALCRARAASIGPRATGSAHRLCVTGTHAPTDGDRCDSDKRSDRRRFSRARAGRPLRGRRARAAADARSPRSSLSGCRPRGRSRATRGARLRSQRRSARGRVPPRGQASSTFGPSPDPQSRASPSSRPRIRFDAKCSCATDTSPAAHRSPSSRRYGSTTSPNTVAIDTLASRRSKARCATSASIASNASRRRPARSSTSRPSTGGAAEMSASSACRAASPVERPLAIRSVVRCTRRTSSSE